MSLPTNEGPEPGTPVAPVTMPLEGSRSTDDGILISIYPDVCLTPIGGDMVAVPYPIHARQSDDINTTTTVRQTSMRSHTSASLIAQCFGDEKGTGGGVISGTTGSICAPKTWSKSVRFEGHNVVRHQDEWWMNNKNTVGKLAYIKDVNGYQPVKGARAANHAAGKSTDDKRQSTSGIPATPTGIPGQVNDAIPDSISPGQQYAANAAIAPSPAPSGQVLPTPASPPSGTVIEGPWPNNITVNPTPRPGGPVPAPASNPIPSNPFGGMGDVGGAITLFNAPYLKAGRYIDNAHEDIDGINKVTGLNIDPNDAEEMAAAAKFEKFDQEGLLPEDEALAQLKKEISDIRARRRAELSPDGNRTSEDKKKNNCRVGPYKLMKDLCPLMGQQAHHIVPDYTLRYGTREEAMSGLKRVKDGSGLTQFYAPGEGPFPSFWNGPAICLGGNAKDYGTEHWEAHGADAIIDSLGKTDTDKYPAGTAPMSQIKEAAIMQTIAAKKGQCAKEVREAVDAAFSNSAPSMLGRTVTYPSRLSTDALNALIQGRSAQP